MVHIQFYGIILKNIHKYGSKSRYDGVKYLRVVKWSRSSANFEEKTENIAKLDNFAKLPGFY